MGVLAEVRCEQPKGLVIREKEFRKLGPILAHGVNLVPGLALEFGHSLALDFILTIGNVETDSGIVHRTTKGRLL